MTELKLGDRVHVEGEATIKALTARDDVWVKPDGLTEFWVPLKWCTKIVPPVQVGDTVTAENIEQLEHEGTILSTSSGVPRWYADSSWWTSYGAAIPASQISTEVYGCTVLRVGGAA